MSELKLLEAVKTGNYIEAERLIKTGVDVDQQDEHGWTPLNYAAGQGDLPMVRCLIENGADPFCVGRDRRLPYDIALAAGRVSVVKYLKEVEERRHDQKPSRYQRQYCKAYYLRDLRKYPEWRESRVEVKKAEEESKGGGSSQTAEPIADDKIVYLHQDFTVTESMWRETGIIFDQGDAAWVAFCVDTLNFKAPDDLDLIVANEAY